MRVQLDQTEEAKFAMAPMIDMVFLLLVFFMIASRFSQVQSVPLEIPDAAKAVVPKDRPDRLVVNITSDGTIHVGPVVVDDDELRAAVQEHKDANPNIKIYVRADKETQHKEVRKVMTIISELGIDDFIFGAFQPQ